ncbi:exopolysaccharide biosynthesis polyprenyl glycosylphosphotransferase, partial [Marinibactrum halimedae]|uniref:exopolysaccharide biosynthesis polyprenyl glycosylphosphotransferase n=1 Tax=Marinibactrum halimedae TaxID=1444977 RepID=UPI001E49AAEC
MDIRSKGLVKPHSSLFALLARVLDFSAVLLGVVVTALFFKGSVTQDYLVAALGSVVCLQLAAEFAEIYRSWRSETIWAEAKQVSLCWSASFIFALAVGSMTHLEDTLFSWPQFAQWYLLTLVCLLSWRLLARFLLQRARDKGHNTRSVAIAGNGALAIEVAHRLENCTWGGYVIKGFYDDRQGIKGELEDVDLTVRDAHGVQRVQNFAGEFSDLIASARRGEIDKVYLTLPMRAEKRIKWLIKELSASTVSVYLIPDVFMFDLLHARTVNLNGVPAIGVVGEPNRGTMSILKRMEDVILAGLILALISGPMLCIAAAVKLTSSGPIFFRQTRYGLDGKPFKVWKFRTMTVCEDNSAQIKQAQKNDARITPLGGFLRRTSLDELPQFINVLEGNMSIVGPRPHAVAHNEMYREQISGYMLRHTGLPSNNHPERRIFERYSSSAAAATMRCLIRLLLSSFVLSKF